MFINRDEAAKLLITKLEKYKNTNTLILAIPKGGVPLGYRISKELNIPLNIIITKKIGHPKNKEFAIGSVSLLGTVINDNIIDVSDEYIEKESQRILTGIEKKFNYYMGNEKAINTTHKTIIIVDDGIATGNTMQDTINIIKKGNPEKIIVAVPVAANSSAKKISKLIDEFMCLYIPENFMSIGQFYKEFSQIKEDEITKCLKETNRLYEATSLNNRFDYKQNMI